MTRFFFALCSVALLGCDAVLGIEVLPRGLVSNDASVADTDTGPPPPVLNEACVSCETTACTAERNACASDSSCSPLLTCLNYCAVGDVLCRGACENAQPAGARSKTFADLDLCRRKSCVNQCFGAEGFGTAIDKSCACQNTSCAAQMLACVQSGLDPVLAPGACDRRLACIAEKPNPDRYVDCVMDLVGGDQANALLGCMKINDCKSEGSESGCPIYSGVFGCLGNYTYGKATASTIKEFTFGLENLFKEPIEGATVVACSGACGPGCPSAGGGVTDARGKATFELKTIENTFNGCIYVAPFGEYMGMNVVTGRQIRRNESMITSYALQEGVLAIYAEATKPLVRDEFHGHLLIAIHDCIWRRVPGVTLKMDNTDDKSRLAYLRGDTAPAGLTATTADGAAAWINVPIGVHTLEAYVGTTLIARQDITVRARELTDVNLFPLSK